MVHGDDFTALGARTGLACHEQGLAESRTIVVKGQLGKSEECETEIKMLDGMARIDGAGFLMGGDPRHAEILIEAFPEMSLVASPGVRKEDMDYDATLDQERAAEQSADSPQINSLENGTYSNCW